MSNYCINFSAKHNNLPLSLLKLVLEQNIFCGVNKETETLDRKNIELSINVPDISIMLKRKKT